MLLIDGHVKKVGAKLHELAPKLYESMAFLSYLYVDNCGRNIITEQPV